jgi:hypothetical protein
MLVVHLGIAVNYGERAFYLLMQLRAKARGNG